MMDAQFIFVESTYGCNNKSRSWLVWWMRRYHLGENSFVFVGWAICRLKSWRRIWSQFRFNLDLWGILVPRKPTTIGDHLYRCRSSTHIRNWRKTNFFIPSSPSSSLSTSSKRDENKYIYFWDVYVKITYVYTYILKLLNTVQFFLLNSFMLMWVMIRKRGWVWGERREIR